MGFRRESSPRSPVQILQRASDQLEAVVKVLCQPTSSASQQCNSRTPEKCMEDAAGAFFEM